MFTFLLLGEIVVFVHCDQTKAEDLRGFHQGPEKAIGSERAIGFS